MCFSRNYNAVFLGMQVLYSLNLLMNVYDAYFTTCSSRRKMYSFPSRRSAPKPSQLERPPSSPGSPGPGNGFSPETSQREMRKIPSSRPIHKSSPSRRARKRRRTVRPASVRSLPRRTFLTLFLLRRRLHGFFLRSFHFFIRAPFFSKDAIPVLTVWSKAAEKHSALSAVSDLFSGFHQFQH